ITTPVLKGAMPDRRLTAQSWLNGQRPARPGDVAVAAGRLLASFHAAPLFGMRPRGPAEHLADTATTCRVVAALVPWLEARVEVLLGTLELAAPSDLELVAAHGGFHAGQLLENGDEL